MQQVEEAEQREAEVEQRERELERDQVQAQALAQAALLGALEASKQRDAAGGHSGVDTSSDRGVGHRSGFSRVTMCEGRGALTRAPDHMENVDGWQQAEYALFSDHTHMGLEDGKPGVSEEETVKQ